MVLRFGPYHRELHQYLGHATNNVAELAAIKAGLEAVKNPSMSGQLHTDSTYAIGVITGQYKVRKNRDLIMGIQKLISDQSYEKARLSN